MVCAAVMTQFYTRYVPPNRSQTKPVEDQAGTPTKRKHDDIAVRDHASKRQKVNGGGESNVNGESLGHTTAKSILEKYSVTRTAKSQDNDTVVAFREKERKKKSKRRPSGDATELDGSSITQDEAAGPLSQNSGGTTDEQTSKYSGVLRKYGRSQDLSRSQYRENEQTEVTDAPTDIIRDLAPIPQPQAAEIEAIEPAYSTLPSWQSNATTAGHDNVPFSQLGLTDRMLSNLQSHGLHQASSIQSTVIPLIIPGPRPYRGDLCVAAATGSGKTLAYAIPMIEYLKRIRGSGLRAVIVVPTRELVKQVRETCELCAAGSSIQIVTASGSKSLQKEQNALIAEDEFYDPEAYQKELNAPIDWTTFSLQETLAQAARKIARGNFEKRVNYVTRSSIKADLLITTPGRLVDHLQSTRGFHLDDVKWLVVDEADRLLNESYQDWIDVVVPALQSRRAMKDMDQVLTHMRMELPPRFVRKVLLSATMTRDISKLKHIGLNNPKLVVLNSSKDVSERQVDRNSDNVDGEINTNALQGHTLPSRLQETAVVFKDNVDKPLILLQLLEQYLNIAADDAKEKVAQNGSLTQSDEETSSGADTDTDTDATSDSGASASSEAESTSTNSTSSDDDDDSESSERMTKKYQLPKTSTRRSVQTQSVTKVLIFTRSTASASRLSRLLSIISKTLGPKITTLTRSTASSASSRKALSTFRTGKTPILIATDRASRGIDVPGLDHVISYDVPGSALTYIHRVGRTARAGKAGHAWTLIEHREGKWFWEEIGGKNNDCIIRRDDKVKKVKIEVHDEAVKKKYDEALQALGSEVHGE